MDLFGRIGVGEFDARVEVTSGDELGEMSNSLNAMLDNTLDLIQTREQRDSMQSSVVKLLDEVGGVADGDLTVEAEVTSDITGAIADSFNMMIVQLREIIQDVQEATLEVSSSANEIRATTEHLSKGSEAQAAQISGTSSAIEDMASSIQQVSENAATSAQVGEQALVNAQQGILAVQNTMEGMTRIRDQVQETAKRIKRLGESSQEIGDIVQLIGDIADRTSILALNASIQAAMAGDAGQGFAVVAEEVERLAERSTEATKQIDTLIRTIQNETNEAVAAMESTTNEVVEGSLLAEEAGQALSEIGTVSGRLQELIQSISMASQQQARGSEELAHSMVEIAEVTQQTAVGTKQAAVSINTLATLADELRASVSAFKLPGSNGNVPEEEVIDLSN
jgi:twitching motility protein PilJ